MTVAELINELNKIEDKNTDIFIKNKYTTVFGNKAITINKKVLHYMNGNTVIKRKAYILN